MSLFSLPEEILILITKQLDIKSLLNLYNTCQYIRNIVCMKGVIKECHLSLNTMATARSLKLPFFKDISRHLQELNMSGVQDASKSSLLPAMKRLKNLKTFNIAYTNITILDLIEIYAVCPTIINITINFKFEKPSKCIGLPNKIMVPCQQLFQNFQNVHFVGSFFNLLNYSVHWVLILAKLDTLIYTIAENSNPIRYHALIENKPDVEFNQFEIYFLNWKKANTLCENVMDLLNLENFEFIIIRALHKDVTVYSSQLFTMFFDEHFDIDTRSIAQFMPSDQENVAIMIWNRETTKFDNSFYSNLFKRVQIYFPCNFNCRQADGNIKKSFEHDWFCILKKHEVVEENRSNEPALKKKRIAVPNNVLDYDEIFKDKRKVQLRLHFLDYSYPIVIRSSSNYLKKLTCLIITGTVRYGTDFFNVLFSCCDNLVTLNSEGTSLSRCSVQISNSISLSKSIKNLRIIDRFINCDTLFAALSQCKTLENIHIHDVSCSFNELADPIYLFQQCDNLYYFSVYAHLTARTKKLQVLKNAKFRSGKHHLRVELHNTGNNVPYFYDPFIDVFRLSSIRQPL